MRPLTRSCDTPVRLPRLMLLLALSLMSLSVLAKPYVVGVENIDYRPYQSGLDGRFTGFGRELLDAFARAAGIELVYQPLPPSRLLASLLRDRIDFKYPDDPAWQPALREGYGVRYSRPIVAYRDGTLVRAERLGGGLDAVHTLGTVVGFTPIAWRDPLAAGRLTLTENADFGALLQQLLAGRIDALYANVAVAREQAQRLLERPDAVVFDPALPTAGGAYRLSTRQHPQLLEQLDQWLQTEAAWVAALQRRHGLDF